MPDRDKVIKGLESCLNANCLTCPYWHDEPDRRGLHRGIMQDALELLKAQEPVPPIIEVQIDDTALYFCGNCKSRGVGIVSSSGLGRRDDFCANCGRAVKWNG